MASSKAKRIAMAVSAEERATIKLGAAIAGVSMSRFVVDAAVRAAERILRANGSPDKPQETEARLNKGIDVQIEDGLIDLCKELHRIKQHAEALGIFTNDRELLTCPKCGLQEDVQADGRLTTFYRDSEDFTDSGLRFIDAGNGQFSCPQCQALIDAEFL
jgi:predicted RNA-binding Zn-ribbon protein involved in translation (DUF1610 family)